jgi:hypothetical protein
MASTYSTNLALELIGTGDQSGTWGTTTNTNLGTLIEQAISGYTTYPATGGTDTITIPNGASGVARNMYIEVTGAGGGSLIVPANKKLYFIYNHTSSPASAVTVKVSGLTGISVPSGAKMCLVCNGTDIYDAVTYINISNPLTTTSGGTGLSSYTAGDIIYYASGTAFTKLGIGAANTVLTSSGTAPQWSTSVTISGNATAAAMIPSGSTVPTNGMYLPATNSVGFSVNSTLAAAFDSTKSFNLNGGYTESVVSIGNSGASQTLSLANGTFQTVTMTGNCTFTMPTATAGKSFILIVNTGAGSFTGTFTSVKWSSGTAPTITTTASKYDLLSFFSDGTNWFGVYQLSFS